MNECGNKAKLSAEMQLPNSVTDPQTEKVGIFKATTPIGSILNKAAYMALFVLFITQLVAILHNHSHLGGLSMFDTVMLLIVKMDTVQLHKWLFPGKNVSKSEIAPFLLIVACTVFEALIFVNFTHAIEAVTCADSSSHFSVPFLASVCLNVIVKSLLVFFSRKMSVPNISASRQYFLHFGAPLVTVSLALANQYLSPETDEVISVFDAYLGVAMSVLLSVVVFPLFKKNVPFLLCDVPKGAKEEQMKVEIEQKLPNLRIDHLHIYSKWPGHKFDVFMHVSIHNTNCSREEGSLGQPTNEQSLRQMMHALQKLLRGKGARRVTVQPWLAVPGEQQQQGEQKQNENEGEKQLKQFTICVSEKCARKDKSCCSNNNSEEDFCT